VFFSNKSPGTHQPFETRNARPTGTSIERKLFSYQHLTGYRCLSFGLITSATSTANWRTGVFTDLTSGTAFRGLSSAYGDPLMVALKTGKRGTANGKRFRSVGKATVLYFVLIRRRVEHESNRPRETFLSTIPIFARFRRDLTVNAFGNDTTPSIMAELPQRRSGDFP